MRRPVVAGLVTVVAAVTATGASAQVLRVGSYKGVAGQYSSIQAAVDAAKSGDWVLVGPGDYKAQADHRAKRGAQPADTPAGVTISTPNLYLRGMDRNKVVVDGTKPGTAQCSPDKAAQDFGPAGVKSGDKPLGRNGVLVWKAKNVWVQNMTACNFLGGSGKAGNGFWWNGGDGSGKVGGYGFLGSYLNATSTFYDAADTATAAQYGIFSSNWSGGTWDQTYTSNFNDSGYYIGACQQICNQVVDHARAQFSALGYSGSNSGGSLVIKNSQFDQNKDGFDTNSQNGDDPSPQNGACPNNGTSPITHTHSCWVFMNNFVHDNNNPNVPALGLAAIGPVGTGMSVSGGRNDTIMNNRFENNNAWGIIFVPFLDSGPPCVGGNIGALGCVFDEWGLALLNNKFANNGSYGHPTNGDFAHLSLENGHPTNCYSGNTDPGPNGFTSSPANVQQTNPTCDGHAVPADSNGPFLNEVLCNTGVQIVSGVPPSCPSGPYPKRTQVVMHPLPAGLASMPNPCSGVSPNPWCNGQVTQVAACVGRSLTVDLVQLALAARERFVSVTVKVAHDKPHSYSASGGSTSVPVALGKHHGHISVAFTEKIKVGSHTETIRFTRVYRRC